MQYTFIWVRKKLFFAKQFEYKGTEGQRTLLVGKVRHFFCARSGPSVEDGLRKSSYQLNWYK